MGSNLPTDRQQSLKWLEARIEAWSADPASVGLTSAAVADLTQHINDTRDAFISVETIRAQSQIETVTYTDRARAMQKAAAPMIANIKNFADNQSDPMAVYEAAAVSPQSPRGPTPRPATPSNLRVNLASSGGIELKWDGKGAVGTLYEVYRRVDGETSFTLLANVDAKTKEYTDAGLPVGTTFATYQIRAIRADKQSAYSTQFNIQFGPISPVAETTEAA